MKHVSFTKWHVAIIFLLVSIIVAVKLGNVAEHLTLEKFVCHSHSVQSWIDSHYSIAVCLYVAAYVGENVLALPLAAGLSIGAGFFFGIWPATFFTLIATTIGALISFFLARYLVGRRVQENFQPSLYRFNRLFEKFGIYFLIAARFVPLIPFALVNMGAGLTLVPWYTFALTTVVGMIPLVMVYTVTGAQLSELESIDNIFSWRIIFLLVGLVVLTLLPVLLKYMYTNGYKHKKSVD